MTLSYWKLPPFSLKDNKDHKKAKPERKPSSSSSVFLYSVYPDILQNEIQPTVTEKKIPLFFFLFYRTMRETTNHALTELTAVEKTVKSKRNRNTHKFLRTKVLHVRPSVCLSVRPSVCLCFYINFSQHKDNGLKFSTACFWYCFTTQSSTLYFQIYLFVKNYPPFLVTVLPNCCLFAVRRAK